MRLLNLGKPKTYKIRKETGNCFHLIVKTYEENRK